MDHVKNNNFPDYYHIELSKIGVLNSPLSIVNKVTYAFDQEWIPIMYLPIHLKIWIRKLLSDKPYFPCLDDLGLD